MTPASAVSANGFPDQVIEVDGRTITVRPRRNKSARRITLRVDARGDCAILTLPRRTSLKKGIGFAREKAGWLASKLAALPPLTPFADDATVPFRGAPLLIRHFPLAGREPVRAEDVLYVPGEAERIPARVTDWMKAQARDALDRTAAEKARAIGRAPPPIGIRDPRARWGSCSARGRLSFSWRLIMAPPLVLDYVVAHEVAHLVHLNHGRGFREVVGRLADAEDEARRWLAREGSGLHRYG